MTPYSSTGRGGVRHHYYACTRRCHGDKGACDAPYIPAQAIEEAMVQRCIELSADEQARDRIVAAAVKEASEEGRRLEAQIGTVRRRLTGLEREIGNLVGVLRNMGDGAPESIGEELRSLETEKKQLRGKLNELAAQKRDLKGLDELEQQFLDSWRGLGDLLKLATPEEQRKLIRHLVEVIEWKAAPDSTKRGTYVIRFFPEAVREREGLTLESWPDPATNEAETGSPVPVLTPVRKVVQKAPRAGLEPAT